jgi:L-ascorbate metabolism protein UlaG (beta-lactamase superfamily)
VLTPLKPSDLPPIDLLLISHAHMDHTDPPSLRQMAGTKHVIVATNTMKVYQPFKFSDIRELDWGQSLVLSPESSALSTFDVPTQDPSTSSGQALGLRTQDLRVEALEVRHAGWRMPWDPCRSRNEKNGFSYNGYLVEKRDANGEMRAFVFGGDTGYIKTFRELGDRMRAEGREIECAILPIGTYNPWVEAHCNPEQAWQITQEMNARVIVPVHWNTFVQSSEPRDEPMHWLKSVVDFDEQIALTEHGQTWEAS